MNRDRGKSFFAAGRFGAHGVVLNGFLHGSVLILDKIARTSQRKPVKTLCISFFPVFFSHTVPLAQPRATRRACALPHTTTPPSTTHTARRDNVSAPPQPACVRATPAADRGPRARPPKADWLHAPHSTETPSPARRPAGKNTSLKAHSPGGLSFFPAFTALQGTNRRGSLPCSDALLPTSPIGKLYQTPLF